MIPKVHLVRSAQRPDGAEKSAFARGPRERPLHIWLDAESVTDRVDVQLVRGFFGNVNISGREVSSAHVKIDDSGRAQIDWVGENQRGRSFIDYAGNNIDSLQALHPDIPIAHIPGLRERLVLAMGAERVGCDVFVSEAPEFLQLVQTGFHETCNARTVAQSLAVIGLHLRLREDFVLDQVVGFKDSTSSSDFYGTLARGVLPDIWRWIALLPKEKSGEHFSVDALTHAISDRLARALRARDRLHGHLLRDVSMSTIDEALFYFDGFLTALAGVFDVTARAMHRIHGLRAQRVSWREPAWRRALCSAQSEFVRLLDDRSPARDTIDALFLLRNTIHEEPLSIIGVLGSQRAVAEYRAALPQKTTQRLLNICNRRGGAARWGLSAHDDELVSVKLNLYVEALLEDSTRALFTLMKAMRFPGERHEESAFISAPADIQMFLPRMLRLAGCTNCWTS